MKIRYITIATVIVLLLGIAGFLGYGYMYAPHRDVAQEKAAAVISATALQEQFANLNGTQGTWADEVIEVHGWVSNVEQETTIIVDNRVLVDLTPEHQHLAKTLASGTKIAIKGRCVGYDDLLEIVKIDQAVLLNPQNNLR